MTHIFPTLKYIIFFLLIAISIGVTAWLTPQAYRVHYHANMAVVIDGAKWDFSREKYMEEVERCNVTVDVRPQDRIHLHDKNADTVHVHMAASTWGDLFANLSWNIGNDFFLSDEGGEYRSGSGKNIYYILNGEELILSPTNTIVGSEDRLLVYYGTGTFEEVLLNFYPLVSRNAIEYNGKEDPASCKSNAKNAFFGGISKKLGNVWEQFQEKLPHSHTTETADE